MVPATEAAEKAGSTFFVNISDTTDPGYGTRALMYVTPKASATATRIDLPANACENILNFKGTFQGTTIVPATGSVSINWSQITTLSTNGVAVPLPKPAVQKVQLGFVPNKTPQEVEANVLQLETMASPLWQKDLVGGASQTKLDDLKDGSGALFSASGFANRGAGTWVLALSSTRTQNPAPVVMTVLTPM
jgi:hypothetical protein